MAKCSVYKHYCAEHGFKHGAEAEELREGIERLLRQTDGERGVEGRYVSVTSLQRLLDRVDASDSLAYLEAQRQEDEDSDENDDEVQP